MRERERVNVGDEPIRICHTTSGRIPFVTNVGGVPVVLDIAAWPMTHGLTLAPGATTSFPSPLPVGVVATIFAVAPTGNGQIEYLYLR